MSAEVLRLHGVGVCRDRSMLLKDVDWAVRADESWVVVGPNGAGKTTLLQVAAGLILPTEGFAEVLGEPVVGADLTELRSRVGISSAAVAEQVPRGEKVIRSEEHTSALQSRFDLVCRLLLEKKK